MLVITILSIITIALGTVFGIRWFDRYSHERFGHRFFTNRTYLASTAIVLALGGGSMWWESAKRTGDDPWNGIVLMLVGATAALALFVWNVRRTNVPFGVAGSLFQTVIFGFVGVFGIVVLVGFLVAMFMPRPVYVVNR